MQFGTGNIYTYTFLARPYLYTKICEKLYYLQLLQVSFPILAKGSPEMIY